MTPLMTTFSRPEISGWKPGAQLDQRRDPAVDAQAAAGRSGDPGHQLEQGALPEPFSPITAKGRAPAAL